MITENEKLEPAPAEVPEAVVKARKRHFSIVWLVPVVALLIGAWLVYKAYSEKGPTITIKFETAEGLEAGKTKIKYKDVELGTVEAISLSKDLRYVVVTAELVKQAEKFVTENTRFWVVRARVAAGEVSGLGTLFSGAYIGMDPGKPGKPKTAFEGLQSPPVVTTDLPGRHFILRASQLGSLDVGSPVYYRRIKVGQVVSYHLNEDGQAVTVRVFINAPHDKRVHQNTRFWNVSGLDVNINANGVRIDTESVVSLLIGGLAFDNPPNLEPGGLAEAGHTFKLYDNFEATREETYVRKEYYLLYFDRSVRGLNIRAPVEFRGIKIGEVTDIRLQFHTEEFTLRIPVLIEMEPDRIEVVGGREPNGDEVENLDRLVQKGLRAQLKTSSLLTGQLYVDLDFYSDAPPATVVREGPYRVLPTIPAPLEEITTSVAQVLKKLERLPIEQIGKDLQSTVQGAERLINSSELQAAIDAINEATHQARLFAESLNTGISPELQKAVTELNATLKEARKLAQNFNSNVTPGITETLEEAQATLKSFGNTVNKDSPLYIELKRVLRELGEAARSIRLMADYLERNPDAIIYGKGRRRK